MNYKHWAIIVGLFVGAILFSITLIFLDNYEVKQKLMYDNCCDGSACTDTHYDSQTNICHLMNCENNPTVLDKSGCRYIGKNVTK